MKKMLRFPFSRQCYNYDCGANAMESVLEYYGLDVREDKIMKIAKTTRRGTNFEGLARAAKKFGIKFKQRVMTIEDIKKNIDKKRPVIVDLQAWRGVTKRGRWIPRKTKNWKELWKDGHYVVAIGYNKKRIYFEDPSATTRTYLSIKELKNRWHDVAKGRRIKNWGMVFYGRPDFDPEKPVHMD